MTLASISSIIEPSQIGIRRMKVAKTSISYKDVIDFFEDADIDLANLTHQLATAKLNERIEKRQATGERLKKARAARKPKVVAGEQAAPVASDAPVETVTEVHRGPGRPRVEHVSA